MPIRPQHRWLYPIDWPQLTNLVRFQRAQGCCEQCSRPHGETVSHLGDGRWWDARSETWRDDRGRKVRLRPLPSFAGDDVRQTRVYLATAHLDHDPGNNAGGNLKALCQRCHILHDALEHNRQRLITLHRRKAIGDLFLGPYPATGGFH